MQQSTKNYVAQNAKHEISNFKRNVFRFLLMIVSAVTMATFNANTAQAKTTAVSLQTYFTSPDVESYYPNLENQAASLGETFKFDAKQIDQSNLVSVAYSYLKRPEIPYIWEGGKEGKARDCAECRKCVALKKPDLKSRFRVCEPCRKCGLDCSHYVNRVYKRAGFQFPYASTHELIRYKAARLDRLYRLADVGKESAMSQAGDLVLYPGHVVMIVRKINSDNADVIHATWMGDKKKLGGIRFEENVNLKSMVGVRKPIARILRHKNLHQLILAGENQLASN